MKIIGIHNLKKRGSNNEKINGMIKDIMNAETEPMEELSIVKEILDRYCKRIGKK